MNIDGVMKTLLGISFGLMVFVFMIIVSDDNLYIMKNLKGKNLYCAVTKNSSEYSLIPKDKIVGYDSQGYWEFTNGYAKNCYLEDK